MKRLILLLGALTLLLPLSAAAQPRANGVGLHGGFGVYNGGAVESAFSDEIAPAVSSWAFTLPWGFHYNRTVLPLGNVLALRVRTELNANYQGFAGENPSGDFDGTEYTAIELPILANLLVDLSSQSDPDVRLNVFVGPQFAFLVIKDSYTGQSAAMPPADGPTEEFTDAENRLQVGMQLGIGVDLPLGPLVFSVRGRINANFTRFSSDSEATGQAMLLTAGLAYEF